MAWFVVVSKDEHFYFNGILALPERWAKVVANDGQYFEWFISNHFFTINLHFHQKNSGNLVAHLIQKKSRDEKLFVLVESTNFVWNRFWYNVYFSFQFTKIQLKFKKFHFFNKLREIKKNVKMENYLFEWRLQILIGTFFGRMYILYFDFKKYYWQ